MVCSSRKNEASQGFSCRSAGRLLDDRTPADAVHLQDQVFRVYCTEERRARGPLATGSGAVAVAAAVVHPAEVDLMDLI